MAVGDVVVNMCVAVSTSSKVTLQPASGVTLCITYLSGEGNSYNYYEGVNSAGSFKIETGQNNGMNGLNGYNSMKLFINNSQYIRFGTNHSAYDNCAYSGIQTA
jgi:hypothetical protein